MDRRVAKLIPRASLFHCCNGDDKLMMALTTYKYDAPGMAGGGDGGGGLGGDDGGGEGGGGLLGGWLGGGCDGTGGDGLGEGGGDVSAVATCQW